MVKAATFYMDASHDDYKEIGETVTAGTHEPVIKASIQNVFNKYTLEEVEADKLGIEQEILEEVQKLNAKYSKALKDIYAEQSREFQKKIEQTSITIRKSLQDISLDGLTRLHGRHTVAIEKLRMSMFFCTGIIGLSAFIHVALYILR